MKEQEIQAIVNRVLSRLDGDPGSDGSGIFEDVEEAVRAASVAQIKWIGISKDAKAKIISALRDTMHQHAQDFARMSQEETGMGRVEDKVKKHHNAADATPGLEDLETRSWTGDKGLVYDDYAPYGVIAAVTPSTHPIPVLFNSMIIMISPGNAVVFNVHPAAKNVSRFALEIFNKTIVSEGGPANLVTMIKEPTLESVNQLFNHSDIAIIAATGGPALVDAAFNSGKKVIAAGPGNPPVLVDATADLKQAAQSIIEGAAFDNNILCIAEKEVFVVQSVYEDFLSEMKQQGAVLLDQDQIEQLVEKVFQKSPDGQISINRDFIGKNANILAAAIGLKLDADTRLLIGKADFDCPFVQEEQMMPYLPVVPVRDEEEGIHLSVKAEHGYGHTAMIHSNDFKTITHFAQAINTSIVVVNGSCLVGNGGNAGEGTFSHTIASPTGEGICTPRHFARMRRLSVNKTLNINGKLDSK